MKNNFEINSDVNSNLFYTNSSLSNKFLYCISIPTYNRFDLLKKTVISIMEQKKYDLCNICIVICDNNPDISKNRNEFINWINELDVSIFYYVNEKNIGIFGNWNRCFELAQSENVIFIHDDDFLCDYYLYEIDKIIRKNKNIDILIPLQYNMQNNEIYNSKQNMLLKNRIYKYPLIFNYLTGTMAYGSSGCYFKKSSILNTTGFSVDDYWPISDWIFYLENYDKLNIYKLHNRLFVYRIDVNMGRSSDVILKEVEIGDFIFKEIFRNKIYYKILHKLIYKGQIAWYANIAIYILAEKNDVENIRFLEKKYINSNTISLKIFKILRKISMVMYKIYIIITMR